MSKLLRPALLIGLLVVFSRGLWAEEPSAKTQVPSPRPSPTKGKGEEAQSSRPTAGVAKYDLKYKFTPGETLRSEVVHRATVQTTIQGTSQTAETESKSIKVWKVQKVANDGTATFAHLVENIDMWQRTTGRQEVRYNSQTDKEAPPGYEDVAKAVGVALSVVTMDNKGTILKRSETRQQPMSMSTQMTMPMPMLAVAIGDSWSSPLEIEVTQKDGSLKKIQTRQKFTLEAVADKLATIKVDSQILTPVSDPAIEAQLIQRLSEGTVTFDIDAGRVVSQQLDLDRHVIGFSGAASSMHYVTRFTEKLLPQAEQTARRNAAKPAAKSGPAAKPQTPKKR
jgi:hypothetical protein